MPDENTSAPPNGNPPDLPLEPAEAVPSITADTEESVAPGLPQAKTEATPPAGKFIECRSEPRVHVRWYADAFIDGHDVYHGFIKDVSLHGTDIFLEHNLQNVKFLKLHIYLPPIGVSSEQHVVEVSGKIVHIVYDSNESFFRIGVNFLQFELESDLAYLRSRIANH